MSHAYKLPLALALATALSLSQVAPAFAAPNIVLMIADDMGWGDVGYNDSEIRTPEIDRLAADGMTLNRFYAHAVCTPTRTALMTGRLPLRTGAFSPSNPWYSQGLALDEKLLQEYFQEAGYQTHAVGKWHMGPNEAPYHPLNRGFDSFYGHLHGYINYDLHTAFGRLDWQRNGETIKEEGYSTRLIGSEAVRIIRERDSDKPLFLYVAFNAPHAPLQAPEESIAEYADIDDPHRRTYAAMVTEMDRVIADITAALEDEALTDNTLLMFFSDNGGVPDLGADNGPLRGRKSQAWEGGMRVPALLSWPAELEGGSVFDEQITVGDLLPTFLAAADIPLDFPKPIDGRNFWPALAKGGAVPGGPVVLSHFSGGHVQHAYFKEQWKLVQAPNEDGELQNYLFAIREDPYEQNDLAAEHPDVLAELVAELEALPIAEPLTLNEQPPDFSAPGAPYNAEPDNRIPTATPYSESGPVPYPPGNWAE